MAANVQPIIMFNEGNRVDYSGLQTTNLQVTYGAGSVSANETLTGQQYFKMTRNATGDDVFGQYLGEHNFVHPFLDPDHLGPPYVMRFQEVMVPLFSTSVGRVFFGLGRFEDFADHTSLKGVGFYCDETGNWFAILVDALGDRVRFDTSADTNQARSLRFEIDGRLKSVRWYVDEVLRKTYVMLTPLDRIEDPASAGVLFHNCLIQSDAGNAISVYLSPGIVAQMSLITDNDVPISTGPPTVPGDFTAPLLGETYRDELVVAWGISSDPDGGAIQYEGQFSSNAGTSWSTLFSLQGASSYVWDISGLTEGTDYQVRVRSHDGTEYSTSYKESDVFYISAPSCTA